MKNISKETNKREINKKLISILILSLFCVPCIFAQSYSDLDFGMNKVMSVVIQFLTSKWIIGIVIALLAFEIVLFITAGRADNQAWKKFVPIILGTGLFLAAPKITGYFINTGALTNTQTEALDLMGVSK